MKIHETSHPSPYHMTRGEDGEQEKLRRNFSDSNRFDGPQVTVVWSSNDRSTQLLLSMLVVAYNALQRNNLQALNDQVVVAELFPELNIYGQHFQGAEMLQDKDKSCKVLRRVFTCFFKSHVQEIVRVVSHREKFRH